MPCLLGKTAIAKYYTEGLYSFITEKNQMANSLGTLTHVEKPLPNGGSVLVLNTGAIIDAEADAMLQALHSRSVGGIKHHLEVLADKGADGFMANFYVGYGHKSIGDLGSTTLFIEGVSMLVAKAIQDSRLYNGQESSTRYIDFQKQPFIDPLGSKASHALLESLRSFYVASLEPLQAALQDRFPRGKDEDGIKYTKAINARSFDILRGFLPAGAATNLAWHTNLRQLADKIALLRHHPLEEVRDIVAVIEAAVQEAHPNSFGHKRYEKTEEYNAMCGKELTYWDVDSHPEFTFDESGLNVDLLGQFESLLKARPPKTELPKIVAEAGTVQFDFLLDFGSFRDIQRHRAVVQRMPLVTIKHGFEPWYLGELPEDLAVRAQEHIATFEKALAELDASPEILQYYIPMGYRLPNRVVGDIPALTYLTELRCTRFVHPTLRKRALQMMDALEGAFGEHGLVLHRDSDPDRFDVKRGEHDIVMK